MKEEELSSFKQWLQKRGFHLPSHLNISYFPDTGWGVKSNIALETGEKILDLPQNLLVTRHTVSNALSLHSFSDRLSAFNSLVVWLMIEKCLDSTSEWFPYIRLLPSTFTTPSYCPSRLLATFPRSIRTEMVSQRRRIQTEFKMLRDYLHQLESLYTLKEDSLTNFHLFRWAWTCVNTRCVSMPNHQMALAPFLDFLNHNANSQSQMVHGNGYDAETNCYRVVSAGRVAPDSQVFISYGLHSNSILAVEYGFLSPGNPHSNFFFYLDDLVSLTQAQPEVMQRIISQRLHLDLCVDRNGASWCLIAIAQILAPGNSNELLNRIAKNKLKEVEQIKIGNPIKLKYRSIRYQYFLEMASILLQEELDFLNTIIASNPEKICDNILQ